MPTAVAIQCVEATTPKVPSISGRVVNGLGLMNFTGGHLLFRRRTTDDGPQIGQFGSLFVVWRQWCSPDGLTSRSARNTLL